MSFSTASIAAFASLPFPSALFAMASVVPASARACVVSSFCSVISLIAASYA